jgi:hypothetical protein
MRIVILSVAALVWASAAIAEQKNFTPVQRQHQAADCNPTDALCCKPGRPGCYYENGKPQPCACR